MNQIAKALRAAAEIFDGSPDFTAPLDAAIIADLDKREFEPVSDFDPALIRSETFYHKQDSLNFMEAVCEMQGGRWCRRDDAGWDQVKIGFTRPLRGRQYVKRSLMLIGADDVALGSPVLTEGDLVATDWETCL